MKHTLISVRDISFKLMTYTRSLELCARMNYETENLDFIDTMDSGELLFDLGACEGRFSLYAANKNIRVIAFEPERRNFEVLKQNVDLNKISEDKLKIINAGVGEKSGSARMGIGQPWEGGHQKVVSSKGRQDLNFKFVEYQKIDIIALDEFVKSNELIPNYLKIDIDGSEMSFLKGAKWTLKRKELKSIIFELNIGDTNFNNIVDILKNSGLIETERFKVPNEPNLFNIVFKK